MMNGKQKLYFLLEAINNARIITAKDRPIYIHPTNDLNNRLTQVELIQLFYKLSIEEKICIVIQKPYDNKRKLVGLEGYYVLGIFPAFDKYYLQIQQEPEYQEFTGKRYSTSKHQNKIQFKLNRKALEKIWNLLQEIEDKRGITTKNNPVRITSYAPNDKTNENLYEERKTILENLQSQDAITELHRVEAGGILYWAFKPSNNYYKIFKDYQNQYKEASKDHNHSKQLEEIKIEDPVYKVKYSEQTRKILINHFLLKKLRSFSDNDAIFAYLYKNPNQDKSDDDIKNGTGLKTIKDLNKFLDNIGFKGELRQVFFKVAKNKIRFNNPITRKYLKEVDIEYLELK